MQLEESPGDVIGLLRENNKLLRELVELKKKEHHQAHINQILHTIFTLAPFIVILVLGYFVWQSISHYLDALNNNINTLKTNFDTLFTFFQKLIPDFSSVVPKIKQTWETVQFWK